MTVEISKKIFLVNAVSTALRKVVMLTVLVWMHGYLLDSAGIDAAEYKLYPLLVSLMLVFPLLTTVSVSGLRRYVTEAYSKGDTDRITQLVSTMCPPIALIGGLILAIGWTMAWNIDSLANIQPQYVDDARLMFALLIFGAAFRVIAAPLGLGIDVRQKFLWRSLLGLCVEFVRVGILTYLLLGVSPRVLWVVVAMVSANVLEITLVTGLSMRIVPALRFRPSQFVRSELRRLLTFGGWSVLNQIAFMLREVSSPWVLEHGIEDRGEADNQVASYSLGALADTNIRRIYIEAYSNALPPITAMAAAGDIGRLRRVYFRLTRYALWLLAMAATPLIIYRDEVFAAYLPDKFALYPTTGAIMAMLLARMIVIFPNSVLGMVSVAREEVKTLALRATSISLVTLGLTIYLVTTTELGGMAAALGTLAITLIASPLMMWPIGLQLVNAKATQWIKVSVLPGFVPLVCAAPVWFGLQQLNHADSLIELALHFLGGAVVYVLALFFLAMNDTDRSDARGMIRRVLRR